jgi:hypothetical protein
VEWQDHPMEIWLKIPIHFRKEKEKANQPTKILQRHTLGIAPQDLNSPELPKYFRQVLLLKNLDKLTRSPGKGAPSHQRVD